MPDELPDLTVTDAAGWRAWLDDHHATPGVWLTLAKKGRHEPTSLTYSEALDEALCYGWIDGLVRGGDDRTYRQRFIPRRPRSRWSAGNVSRAEWLIAAGRMHPAGIAAVERARSAGLWMPPGS